MSAYKGQIVIANSFIWTVEVIKVAVVGLLDRLVYIPVRSSFWTLASVIFIGQSCSPFVVPISFFSFKVLSLSYGLQLLNEPTKPKSFTGTIYH